jgi:hypothetical protein
MLYIIHFVRCAALVLDPPCLVRKPHPTAGQTVPERGRVRSRRPLTRFGDLLAIQVRFPETRRRYDQAE